MNYVLLTHMHADHVSGIAHVKDAKQILFRRPEWKAPHRRAGYIKTMWKGLHGETFHNTDLMARRGTAMIGSGWLSLFGTYSHPPSWHVFRPAENGRLLLANDVGYSTRSWKEIILSGAATDKRAAKRSLGWVKEFPDREDYLKVKADHDLQIKPGIILWDKTKNIFFNNASVGQTK
ncbi:MBL fold metallo-hydrolase [Peribacillus sp. SCS-155]|uniref:MBL fold metallo-hydrolase n=1 Tax=Peribacillus sedimenti TaxID=3115297 RepID=UPI003906ACA9